MRHIPSVTIQALTLRILTLKTNQGTKFEVLKKPMFSLFDFKTKFEALKKPMFNLFDFK